MNRESYEKLYNAYYMRVFSYAMTLSGDLHTAEEIAQETFYRAFVKQKSFRGESDEFTWLCAIAKNLFIDEKRRQSRAESVSSDLLTHDDNIEQKVSDKDATFRIHMALHTMEEPYREVFELRVFGELSFQQIGKIFAKTENWARGTYHRARLKLKERMVEE